MMPQHISKRKGMKMPEGSNKRKRAEEAIEVGEDEEEEQVGVAQDPESEDVEYAAELNGGGTGVGNSQDGGAGLVLPEAVFQQLARDILQIERPESSLELEEALEALQVATEHFLVQVFQGSTLVSSHGNHFMVQASDIKTLCHVLGINNIPGFGPKNEADDEPDYGDEDDEDVSEGGGGDTRVERETDNADEVGRGGDGK
ncbi:hypothetical protein LZL87_006094 [Fusarium oxysporum]|nr:hypothetical protein LZL87_006094 [Fusarium oxysporum]